MVEKHDVSIMDVNYCREQQRKKFCEEEKECDKPCPLGYKPDKRGEGTTRVKNS